MFRNHGLRPIWIEYFLNINVRMGHTYAKQKRLQNSVKRRLRGTQNNTCIRCQEGTFEQHQYGVSFCAVVFIMIGA